MEKHVPYRAYLLRLWPTRRGGRAGYRVSLESVATRERQHFPDLESLFAFLKAQREEPASHEPGAGGKR
jgi:hypothetical protein